MLGDRQSQISAIHSFNQIALLNLFSEVLLWLKANKAAEGFPFFRESFFSFFFSSF